MSMVSYYNPADMYRHQHQAVTSSPSAHSISSPMHTFYAGYQHQSGHQVPAAANAFCMHQDEQQMMGWHHPATAHTHGGMFHHQEFQEYVGAHNMMPLQQHQHQLVDHHESQLPSPPITVSGSDMSSPGGGGGGTVTPPQPQTRPVPVRSPFEWIKKTSYQSQPNPGKKTTLYNVCLMGYLMNT